MKAFRSNVPGGFFVLVHTPRKGFPFNLVNLSLLAPIGTFNNANLCYKYLAEQYFGSAEQVQAIEMKYTSVYL